MPVPTSQPGPLCFWLTGYQGAGKSTLAQALAAAMAEGPRDVRIIDGDAFRAEHSADLGFTRADRDANVARMAAHAASIRAQGVDVVVAAMSPYRSARQHARTIIGDDGFIEVHVATSLATCVARDTKGLYAAAQRGDVRDLPGVDEPFEVPPAPEAVVVMDGVTPEAAARDLLERIGLSERRGMPTPFAPSIPMPAPVHPALS